MRIPGPDRLWRTPGAAPVLGLHVGPVGPDRVAILNRLLATMDDEANIRRRSYSTVEVAKIVGSSERTLRRLRHDYGDELSWREYGGRIRYLPEDIELLRLFLSNRHREAS